MGQTITPVVRWLLLINVGLFLLNGFSEDWINKAFALYPFSSDYFRPWQILTHMFLHAGTGHLISNMLGLFFFGPMLESIWGSQRFLQFYFICGLGAVLLHSGVTWYELQGVRQDAIAYQQYPTPENFVGFLREHQPEELPRLAKPIEEFADNREDTSYIKETTQYVNKAVQDRQDNPSLGASGAIFGILMAFALLFPNTEILLYFLFPIKAKYFVGAYGLYKLYAGFQRAPGDSVAHFAHLGGMLFAWLLVRQWRKDRNRFY